MRPTLHDALVVALVHVDVLVELVLQRAHTRLEVAAVLQVELLLVHVLLDELVLIEDVVVEDAHQPPLEVLVRPP